MHLPLEHRKPAVPSDALANDVSPGAMGLFDVARAVVIVAVITGGLALDQHVAFWGQTLTNAAVWALFLWWLRKADLRQQVCLTACVVYATLGEIFLSLVWGVYDYRLANIPLFVPPGHALLFTLGLLLAQRLKDWIVWAVPLAALPFVLILLITGAGTLDALLFALFLACILFGRARRLYAVMFVLALAMEIYGTWLGNWTWAADVPWLALTSINPPLAAGAFYCVLDLLVVTTVSRMYAPPARPEARVAPAAVLRSCALLQSAPLGAAHDNAPDSPGLL
jgi:hypothetical protein